MKKTKIKFIIVSIIACFFLISIQNLKVSAANGTVNISGGGTYNVGETVAVTFNISANESLYGVDLEVKYDQNILEFISGDNANGSSGTVYIAFSNSSGSKSVSSTIRFKTKVAGSGSISVTDNSYAAGLDGDSLINLNNPSTSVTVKAPVQYSKDNTLKSLQIAPGTLSPSFNPNTTSYSVTVANSTQKVTVSANPNHSAAKVTSLSGADNLKVGSNNVNVVVTAEDGSTKTYTIRVTREQGAAQPTSPPKQTEAPTEEETQEPTSTEAPELPPVKVEVDNKSLYINSDFETSSMPESFSKETMDYDGREINVAKSLTGDLILFYLSNEGEDQGEFYIYDKEGDSFDQYIEVEGRGGRYIILTPKEDLSIPDNYKEGNFSIDGKEVTGWQLEGMESNEFFLVYAMNGSGNKGLYHYDTVEKTFQRYSEELIKFQSAGILDADKLQEDLDASNNEISKLNEKYKADMGLRIKIIIGLIALSIILLITTINLILKNKFLKDDLLEANDFLDNEEEDFEAIFVQPSESTLEKDVEVTRDWSEEFAATKEPTVKEATLKPETNKNPIPPIKDTKKKAQETRKEENKEANKVKSQKEDKSTPLEDASLEEIFEFLNVEDNDLEDKNL